MLDKWQHLTLYPLRWISFGGLHPKHESRFATLQFWLNFLYFGVIVALALLGILVSYKDNIYYTIESILTIVLYLHIMSKYAILHMHKSTLKILLEQRSHFWKLEDFEGDIRQHCEQRLQTALTITKCYLGYSLSVVTSFLLQPIITGQLPVFLYIPEGWYPFLFFSFFLITPAIMASIWGVDTIFYSVSTPVSIQFKLLAYKFENINFNIIGGEIESKKQEETLKDLVDYHNFLILYCHQINKMSSGIFITQFLVAIATSCMQLFIASQPEFGLMNKIKCVSYFTMQIIETAIYCYTTELISESSADVGNAAYRSSWYDLSNNNVKKDIVLIIKRSQKKAVFSGLGLIWINMETFTRIFKTALSFYTYLNTMVYNN